MTSIILSIGDELVLGQTVDTNSAWISQQLAAVGCDIAAHATVPDDQKAIERAIHSAVARCDVLIISGGIGPTEDDLTRQALAAVLEVELEMNQVWLDKLIEFFKSRGRDMPEINKIQAMIPHGATMIENTAGTAAGIHASLYVTARMNAAMQLYRRTMAEERKKATPTVEPDPASSSPPVVQTEQNNPLPQGDERPLRTPKASPEHLQQMFGKGYAYEEIMEFLNTDLRFRRPAVGMAATKGSFAASVPQLWEARTDIFVMPGVPKEMKIMFTRDVLPFIKERSGGAVILSRSLHTFGLGESAVAEKLGNLMDRRNNPSVGTTVANGIVSLRLNARFSSMAEAQQQLEAVTAACEAALGDLIFGRDDQTLAHVVAHLLRQGGQGEKKRTVATAESCTGGLLAKMLTDLPGSSEYFTQGWVTYSNLSKYERLGVPTDVINVYGAVSEAVVEAMAKNARRLASATYALAISGIAGPDGGSPAKPVGTVCIALATVDPANKQQSLVAKRTFVLTGDREMIRDRAAKMALTMLRFELLGKALPF